MSARCNRAGASFRNRWYSGTNTPTKAEPDFTGKRSPEFLQQRNHCVESSVIRHEKANGSVWRADSNVAELQLAHLDPTLRQIPPQRWIHHHQFHTMITRERFRPVAWPFDCSAPEYLCRSQTPKIQHVLVVSVRNPAEVIDRNRNPVVVGYEAVHLVLLLKDIAGGERYD